MHPSAGDILHRSKQIGIDVPAPASPYLASGLLIVTVTLRLGFLVDKASSSSRKIKALPAFVWVRREKPGHLTSTLAAQGL
jgi:hypothetical protein